MIHREPWYREAGLDQEFTRLVEEFKRTQNLSLLDEIQRISERSQSQDQADAIKELESDYATKMLAKEASDWNWKVVRSRRNEDMRALYQTPRYSVTVSFDAWVDEYKELVFVPIKVTGMVQTQDGYSRMNPRLLPFDRREEFTLEHVVRRLRDFAKRFPQDGTRIVPVTELSSSITRTADERDLDRAFTEFRRTMTPESLQEVLRKLERVGQDPGSFQPLWDAVAKIPVEYEEQRVWYTRSGPEDGWDYGGDSAEKVHEDDMAWFVSWLHVRQKTVHWPASDLVLFSVLPSPFRREVTKVWILEPPQKIELIKALLKVYAGD